MSLFSGQFSPHCPGGWGGEERSRSVTSPFSFVRFRQSTKQLPGVTGIFIWHLLSVRHILGMGYMLGV